MAEHHKLADARVATLVARHPPAATDVATFLSAQFDMGLAWVHFPVGLGGLGLDPALQLPIDERLRQAGAPSPASGNPIGHGMVAPTLLVHGTPEQQARYLRPLFCGDEVWCQLFSEPGAGSDLAGLAARARLDGDEWVIDGEKVWTTLAHLARWGLVLARTDPDVPKHAGLTCFVVDMTAPGVEVRPLYQMTGEAEFNEVFLNAVRVPDEHRLGAVGQGWAVAITTLMNERVTLGADHLERGDGFVGNVLDVWRKVGGDTVRRDALARLWVRAEVLRLTNVRTRELRQRGTPGPDGSISKALGAELNKDLSAFCLDLLGPNGMLFPGGYPHERPTETQTMRWSDPHRMFLRLRANSIEGGTTEIMKNILAERVLELPAEPRVDKDRPWRDVPRS